jgi:hypothetical protein
MQPVELKSNNYWENIRKKLSDTLDKKIDKSINELIVDYEINELKDDRIPIFFRDMFSSDLFLGFSYKIKNMFNTITKDYIKDKIMNIDGSYISCRINEIKRLLNTDKERNYFNEIRGWL